MMRKSTAKKSTNISKKEMLSTLAGHGRRGELKQVSTLLGCKVQVPSGLHTKLLPSPKVAADCFEHARQNQNDVNNDDNLWRALLMVSPAYELPWKVLEHRARHPNVIGVHDMLVFLEGAFAAWGKEADPSIGPNGKVDNTIGSCPSHTLRTLTRSLVDQWIQACENESRVLIVSLLEAVVCGSKNADESFGQELWNMIVHETYSELNFSSWLGLARQLKIYDRSLYEKISAHLDAMEVPALGDLMAALDFLLVSSLLANCTQPDLVFLLLHRIIGTLPVEMEAFMKAITKIRLNVGALGSWKQRRWFRLFRRSAANMMEWSSLSSILFLARSFPITLPRQAALEEVDVEDSENEHNDRTGCRDNIATFREIWMGISGCILKGTVPVSLKVISRYNAKGTFVWEKDVDLGSSSPVCRSLQLDSEDETVAAAWTEVAFNVCQLQDYPSARLTTYENMVTATMILTTVYCEAAGTRELILRRCLMTVHGSDLMTSILCVFVGILIRTEANSELMRGLVSDQKAILLLLLEKRLPLAIWSSVCEQMLCIECFRQPIMNGIKRRLAGAAFSCSRKTNASNCYELKVSIYGLLALFKLESSDSTGCSHQAKIMLLQLISTDRLPLALPIRSWLYSSVSDMISSQQITQSSEEEVLRSLVQRLLKYFEALDYGVRFNPARLLSTRGNEPALRDDVVGLVRAITNVLEHCKSIADNNLVAVENAAFGVMWKDEVWELHSETVSFPRRLALGLVVIVYFQLASPDSADPSVLKMHHKGKVKRDVRKFLQSFEFDVPPEKTSNSDDAAAKEVETSIRDSLLGLLLNRLFGKDHSDAKSCANLERYNAVVDKQLDSIPKKAMLSSVGLCLVFDLANLLCSLSSILSGSFDQPTDHTSQVDVGLTCVTCQLLSLVKTANAALPLILDSVTANEILLGLMKFYVELHDVNTKQLVENSLRRQKLSIEDVAELRGFLLSAMLRVLENRCSASLLFREQNGSCALKLRFLRLVSRDQLIALEDDNTSVDKATLLLDGFDAAANEIIRSMKLPSRIHSFWKSEEAVDSMEEVGQIYKQALENGRFVNCLLQVGLLSLEPLRRQWVSLFDVVEAARPVFWSISPTGDALAGIINILTKRGEGGMLDKLAATLGIYACKSASSINKWYRVILEEAELPPNPCSLGDGRLQSIRQMLQSMLELLVLMVSDKADVHCSRSLTKSALMNYLVSDSRRQLLQELNSIILGVYVAAKQVNHYVRFGEIHCRGIGGPIIVLNAWLEFNDGHWSDGGLYVVSQSLVHYADRIRWADDDVLDQLRTLEAHVGDLMSELEHLGATLHKYEVSAPERFKAIDSIHHQCSQSDTTLVDKTSAHVDEVRIHLIEWKRMSRRVESKQHRKEARRQEKSRNAVVTTWEKLDRGLEDEGNREKFEDLEDFLVEG